MSSTTPLSLKCSIGLLLGVVLLTLGCNRKPNACVEVDQIVARVGESVTIRDCSKRGFDQVIDCGNGARFNGKSTLKYQYHYPGNYEISVISRSKKGNKVATSATGIRIIGPAHKEIEGKWQLEKVELREQLEVDPKLSVFDYQLEKVTAYNEIYTITADSIFVDHQSSDFYLFEFKLKYSFEDDLLQINNNNFSVVSYTTTSMVLSGPYFKGFELLYLKKVS